MLPNLVALTKELKLKQLPTTPEKEAILQASRKKLAIQMQLIEHQDELRRQGYTDEQISQMAPLPVGAMPATARPVIGNQPLLLTDPQLSTKDQIKQLFGFDRKNVKAAPVLTDYYPQTVSMPIVFRWKSGQYLAKLTRMLSSAWRMVLVGISTTSVKGGRITGAEGRNLIAIINTLRENGYLRAGVGDRPQQIREQVKMKAKDLADLCGMSLCTLYRALKHPLAHLFIRTQKVQAILSDGSHRNISTLWTVSMYEPEMPADLKSVFWSEEVEQRGFFAVSESHCQDDITKDRPLNTQYHKKAVEIVENLSQEGLSSIQHNKKPSYGMDFITKALDQTGVASKRNGEIDLSKVNLRGCLDRLAHADPINYDIAARLAIHLDSENALQNGNEVYSVAAVGYYKALVWLGQGVVKEALAEIEKWAAKGQNITTKGALLMHFLNKTARAQFGCNIRDLSTEGAVLA